MNDFESWRVSMEDAQGVSSIDARKILLRKT